MYRKHCISKPKDIVPPGDVDQPIQIAG